MTTKILLAVLIVTIFSIYSEHRGYKRGHLPSLYANSYQDFRKTALAVVLNNIFILILIFVFNHIK